MDIGTSSTGTATLSFTFATSINSTTRTWEIMATQIPCHSNYRPPSGCLQWHIGLTGRFQTFNFIGSSIPQHLALQRYDIHITYHEWEENKSTFRYSICIRQELEYCCVQYSKCSDPDSYSIDSFDSSDPAAAVSEMDTLCTIYVSFVNRYICQPLYMSTAINVNHYNCQPMSIVNPSITPTLIHHDTSIIQCQLRIWMTSLFHKELFKWGRRPRFEWA